jgi:hypothetical protein
MQRDLYHIAALILMKITVFWEFEECNLKKLIDVSEKLTTSTIRAILIMAAVGTFEKLVNVYQPHGAIS